MKHTLNFECPECDLRQDVQLYWTLSKYIYCPNCDWAGRITFEIEHMDKEVNNVTNS